jgi:hypothetical protein
MNEGKFQCKFGKGDSRYSPFWHEITLYESTWKGLDVPVSANGIPVLASDVSVQTLYHEATHAYIELDDYDQTQEFGEAMKYYNHVKLENGNIVLNTERAVTEAAAEYVGHRASTVWSAWWRMNFLANSLLPSVMIGKMTVARAEDLIDISGQNSIPVTYNLAMQQRIFGYTDDSGEQSEIAATPIFDKLRDYCDRVILDHKIYDDFNNMLWLRTTFQALYRLMGKYPTLAAAMIRGWNTPYPGGRG